MSYQSIFRMVIVGDARQMVVLGNTVQLYVSYNGVTLGVTVRVKE